MTQKNQVYKCNVCGNIVQVLHPGGGQLVCCGQPMELQIEKTEDEGQEKHLPVIKKTERGIKIKVGSVAHPMGEKHYIEWIEIAVNGNRGRHFLKPGDKPETEFPAKHENVQVRAYCNIHGLWKS
ncbi:MAG: desulfoferrodoxin [Parcubacteria group bacterium]|jgi:superoxide reductase|nr:desulfoferrodoxin [Parcubacteria group bacterium]|tara:strand:+ start:172 stop:546 length:375 start_codon:yes stop_codon:yes gene_type:complete